jgi:hypothetical protein
MPLSNAEKQARWRKRNVIVLTASPFVIVRQLMAMEDQVSLRLIVTLLYQQLNPKDGRCRFVKMTADAAGRALPAAAKVTMLAIASLGPSLSPLRGHIARSTMP